MVIHEGTIESSFVSDYLAAPVWDELPDRIRRCGRICYVGRRDGYGGEQSNCYGNSYICVWDSGFKILETFYLLDEKNLSST
jgi:hypothetical protein